MNMATGDSDFTNYDALRKLLLTPDAVQSDSGVVGVFQCTKFCWDRHVVSSQLDGFIIYKSDGKDIHIHLVGASQESYQDETYRIGTGIMSWAKVGRRRITLTALIRNVAFYQKCGFKCDNKKQQTCYDEYVLMLNDRDAGHTPQVLQKQLNSISPGVLDSVPMTWLSKTIK